MDMVSQINSTQRKGSDAGFTKRKAIWIQWPRQPLVQPSGAASFNKQETPDNDIPWPYFFRD